MHRRLANLCISSASLLCIIPGSIVHSQTAADAAAVAATVPAPAQLDTQLPPLVVFGDRASLESAEKIRRERLEIVDSVVDDDIARLPDLNVSDALQRVAGIQIERDLGEGFTPSIRGLTQMETLLGGREVFTAGTGRNLNFEDIPAEMVSGIDVYKTSSAAQIEGGIGGVIDLRTHRPFDFNGSEFVGSARLIHGDLAQRDEPQFSLLGSDRWQTDAAGEIGALLNVSYQERAFREDQESEGNPLALTNLLPGQTVIAPNGTSQTTSIGVRKRTAGNLVLQWRPSSSLDLYAEGSYAQFRTMQDSYQINVEASPSFVPGSVTVFPGTDDLRSITWTDAPLSILSFARDTVDQTAQAAVGGSLSHGAWTISGDLSHTQSRESLFFSGPFLAGTAAYFTQNLSTTVPSTGISGANLLDPANLTYTGIAYRTLPYDGSLTAARIDADYDLAGSFLRTLSVGLRISDHGANNSPGLIFADAAVTGLTGADRPSFLMPDPYSLFPGSGSDSIANYLVGNLSSARDPIALRSAFGITTPIPAAASPLSLWSITEETRAAYWLAKFETSNMPLDGNIGLRVVHTLESVSGSESAPADATISPIAVMSDYTDWLPSINLRYRLREDWLLRAAVSKSITRPDFDELSPSLTLIPNSVNPSLNQGSAGNPELKPVRADNIDVAVEKYFSRTTALSLTGFLKHVDGFVTTVSNPEVYAGSVYEVSRPQNGSGADIRGFELAYQQFYDFLPSVLSGLGLQANYTYIDSESPNSALGAPAPLQNLSKHSLNLIGIYERSKFSARLAYNWRDRFLSGVTDIVGVGALPVYTAAYGWLDGSLRYRVTDKATVAVEGMNLLHTLRRSYYGVETRPQSVWLDDTQIAVTITVGI
jgi:iron complex outermembrane recepter protein